MFDFVDVYVFLECMFVVFFVDCCSEMEYLFVGYLVGVYYVVWNDGLYWEVNFEFVLIVCKLMGYGVECFVVLICCSGNCLVVVVYVLEEVGFCDVYVVCYGFEGDLDSMCYCNMFNGWCYVGLLWE